MKKVLILGGYGNFGSKIAILLVKNQINIIIAGRNKNKAILLQQALLEQYQADVEIMIGELNLENVAIVINTAGPFIDINYDIAKMCIIHKVHYIDLADGRDFVCNITELDEMAKKAEVAVISGASSVPALSSAVLENFKHHFSSLDSLIFGISPGQKAQRGLATTKGILSYLGKSLKSVANSKKSRYGWQDLYCIKYPMLGYRFMSNCDSPDLDLFYRQYQIKKIQFSAGMESGLLHLGIWFCSWLVRFGLIKNIEKYSETLLNLSHYFNFLGTDAGGMNMIMQGKDFNNREKIIKWFIIIKNGHGPQVPTIPAIILTKKILAKQFARVGAFPCCAVISLSEYLAELADFDYEIITEFL